MKVFLPESTAQMFVNVTVETLRLSSCRVVKLTPVDSVCKNEDLKFILRT